MKPHKVARRRKRPDRTPPPPQPLTRGEKTFLKTLLGLLVAFCLYNGYAYWYNSSIHQHRIPALLRWLGIPYPHVWLLRQFERLPFPGREAVAQSEGQPTERIYYIHSDHLGSPLILTDTNAQVVWRANAEPFGKTTPTANQIVYNPRFPGQYYDKETGLTHNNRRDYNSSTGRYKQPDPVADVRRHLYNYAQNNPTRYVDPEGLETTLLRSKDWEYGAHVPHIAYRVYDEVNGQHVNDMVYTNDHTNNLHPEPYEAYKATHTILEETHLNTTTPEDQQFRDFWFRNQNVNYSYVHNKDCASQTGRAINEVFPFANVPVQRLPQPLVNAVHDTILHSPRPRVMENYNVFRHPFLASRGGLSVLSRDETWGLNDGFSCASSGVDRNHHGSLWTVV